MFVANTLLMAAFSLEVTELAVKVAVLNCDLDIGEAKEICAKAEGKNPVVVDAWECAEQGLCGWHQKGN